VLGALALDGSAVAADVGVSLLPAKAMARPVIDWTGLYFGVHAGFGGGRSTATLVDPAPIAGRNDFGGLIGGVQAGYNIQFSSGLLLGLEADISFPSYIESNSIVSKLATARSDVVQQWDFIGSTRGRIGYAAGPWLAYATGGLAWAGERYLNNLPSGDLEKALDMRLGWAIGAGLEYAFAPHWSARLDYLYYQFDKTNVQFPSAGQYAATMDMQSIRIGLNRKLGGSAGSADLSLKSLADPESDRWEIHGQTTYLGQGYPSFRAPYSGANSLTPGAQYQATWSNSLFLNARLWDGGEVYYNPELLQGFGLSDTVGVAGFPSGEAQKSNFP
jgi:high affinity Mn2+ porin